MALTEAPEITPSDDRSLEDRVADTVGLLNLAAAELVGLVGEALRTGAWQGAGIRSPEHWVAWHCGVSGARARRLVTSARGLEALPVCRGVFEAGSLSEDQVAVIVRHTDTAHDRQVADLAPSLTVTQLQRVLPSLPRTQPAPDDDDSPGEPEGRRRLVRFGWDDDGWWWCSMRLPADEGSLMDKALQAARDREFRARHPHAGDDDRHDPGDVSWVDALVALARAGLDALDPDTANGRPPGERTQVILHLDLDREAPPRCIWARCYRRIWPATCPAMRRAATCCGATAPPWRWAGVSTRSTPGCAPSSNTATAAAGCRAVTTAAGSTCIIWSTGSMAARPTPTTCAASVPCTTAWSTRAC